MSPFRGSAAFTERWQNFDLSLEDGVATVLRRLGAGQIG